MFMDMFKVTVVEKLKIHGRGHLFPLKTLLLVISQLKHIFWVFIRRVSLGHF